MEATTRTGVKRRRVAFMVGHRHLLQKEIAGRIEELIERLEVCGCRVRVIADPTGAVIGLVQLQGPSQFKEEP